MNALILALAMAAGLTDPPDSTGTRADATPAWKRQIDADGLPRHTNLVQSELWATRDGTARMRPFRTRGICFARAKCACPC